MFGLKTDWSLDAPPRYYTIEEVPQFDDEGWRAGLKRLGRFGELAQRFAVVPRAGGRLVGVVQIGDEADAQRRLPVVGPKRAGEEPVDVRGRQDQRAPCEKGPAAEWRVRHGGGSRRTVV